MPPATCTIGTDNPAYPPWYAGGSPKGSKWKINDPSTGKGYESAVAYAIAKQLGFSKSQVTWSYVPFNKAFAPGNDIAEFATERSNVEQARAYGEDMRRTIDAIADCRHPVVAQIHGICVGGGLEIAGLADIRICGESSRFGVPINNLGLVMAYAEIGSLISLAGEAADRQYQREHRAALKRFVLAALGMMQAMMYLGALYGTSDIDASMAALMAVAGMVIVTPVLFYSGWPFLAGAWRDLRHRRLGMDVPVAAALLLAWAPSVVNTFRGSGEVYFDSVTMFVFFLLGGRYLEMLARQKAVRGVEELGKVLPAFAERLADWPAPQGERVPVAQLAPGDVVRVRPGEVIPADGVVIDGVGEANEALLTGESRPVAKRSPRAGRLSTENASSSSASAPSVSRIGSARPSTIRATSPL